ncbi:MAG: N-acetylneuraminate synthase family protein [Alphaproteobacteria bacterium]|nr:N-acetylneuraminate synthase family protein [Alphaproteobacteria bacterium]
MTDTNVMIIAEAAQGFEGRELQASLLIKAAASAKANAIKFQMIFANELATPDYEHYGLFSSLEMPDASWHSLMAEANDLGIEIIIDVFGTRSLALSIEMGVTTIMTHATDLVNHALLGEIAASSIQNVILGIGGAHRDEIDDALAILKEKNIILMVGFQGYPTETDDNNINRVQALCQHTNALNHVTIGFADHSLPESNNHLLLSTMAIGAGAKILEKHITLGECMMMEDHESALNPDRFRHYVEEIHQANRAFGHSTDSNDFGMSSSEAQYRKNIRRSIISARAIAAGQTLTAADLTQLRHVETGTFTSYSDLIGRKARHDIPAHTAIKVSDIDE